MTKTNQNPRRCNMDITGERHGFVAKIMPLIIDSPIKALDIDVQLHGVVVDAASLLIEDRRRVSA